MACRKRHEGESFAEYRQRMKNVDRNIKARLGGRLVHNSNPHNRTTGIPYGNTYRKPK